MKPLTACVALALAVHAGLLWLPARLQAAGGRDGGTRAVQVRLAVDETAAAAPTPPPTEHLTLASTDPPPQTSETSLRAGTKASDVADDGAPDRFPPLLDASDGPIRLPDAQMPESGANLRAYVRVNAQGQVDTVSVASDTPGLPMAFNDVVEVGLRLSHLRAAQEADAQPLGDLAYCLAVRFEPEQPAPQLQWLPGAAASPTRCLNGKQPITARDIERR